MWLRPWKRPWASPTTHPLFESHTFASQMRSQEMRGKNFNKEPALRRGFLFLYKRLFAPGTRCVLKYPCCKNSSDLEVRQTPQGECRDSSHHLAHTGFSPATTFTSLTPFCPYFKKLPFLGVLVFGIRVLFGLCGLPAGFVLYYLIISRCVR
jgi:hypothetical protein